jgi:3-oxoacyl-[acyl-carrier protein] reductase
MSSQLPGSGPAGSRRVAVVTGTAQGIGTAIADALEADGLIVHRIDQEQVDVTDGQAVDAFFAEVGVVHVLVNNAGGVRCQLHNPI